MTRLHFNGRSRRPAEDEANSLLNLGYTLLTSECISLLEACGLDCGMGFLHGIVYGRSSLALDIIEPFRANAVDKLVLRLSNWGMLTEQDFTPDPETGYRLSQDGMSLYLEQYEKNMQDNELNIRTAMRREMQKLRHALLNGTDYKAWAGV